MINKWYGGFKIIQKKKKNLFCRRETLENKEEGNISLIFGCAPVLSAGTLSLCLLLFLLFLYQHGPSLCNGLHLCYLGRLWHLLLPPSLSGSKKHPALLGLFLMNFDLKSSQISMKVSVASCGLKPPPSDFLTAAQVKNCLWRTS